MGGAHDRLAVRTRSLSAPELVGSLPAGDYEAIFAAEDSTYETAPVRLELTPGRHSLVFDVADAGLLWVDLRDGEAAHDGRCALRVNLRSGGHFYATFDRAPYVVPFLDPGPHRLSEVDAPGCAALRAPGLSFEIFAGQPTIEIVACERLPALDAAPTGAPR